MTFDDVTRRVTYEVTLARGVPPAVAELAATFGVPDPEVRASLGRLAAERVVVLQHSGELLMVPPFSAVPTPFVTRTPRHTAHANCVWDALGVAVMMRLRTDIDTACGCCGEAMPLVARPDAPPEGDGVVHFAVPARQWWDDIVFT